MFDQVEKLKQEYTDKYVEVDDNLPELARFGGHVGQVKTINMNGRALVQFEAWNNIGWYDIELAALRVVPKPDPAALEAKKQDAKKENPKPVKAAAPSGEKAAPAAGAKKSTADILAAARGKGSAPAAAKPAAGKPAGKPSTADILAAARANKGAVAPAAPAAESTAEAPPAEAAPTPAAKAKPTGSTTLPAGQRPSVPQILAWCREHDGQ